MHELHRQGKVLPHGHLCQPGKDQTHAPMFSYLYQTRATGSNRPQSYFCPGCKQALLGCCVLAWARTGPLTPPDWAGSAWGPPRSLVCISCDPAQRYWGRSPCSPISTGRHTRDAHLLVAALLAKAAELSEAELLINSLKFRVQQVLPTTIKLFKETRAWVRCIDVRCLWRSTARSRRSPKLSRCSQMWAAFPKANARSVSHFYLQKCCSSKVSDFKTGWRC